MALQYVHAKKRAAKVGLDRYHPMVPLLSSDWSVLERIVLQNAQGNLSTCQFAVYAEAGLILGACGTIGDVMGATHDYAREVVVAGATGGRKIAYLNCFLFARGEPVPGFAHFLEGQGKALAVFLDGLYASGRDALDQNQHVRFESHVDDSEWQLCAEDLRRHKRQADVLFFQNGRAVFRTHIASPRHAPVSRHAASSTRASRVSKTCDDADPRAGRGSADGWLNQAARFWDVYIWPGRTQSEEEDIPPSPPPPP